MPTPTREIREYLDANKVKYETIQHPTAYTAQEIAAAAHVGGYELAKPVIVRLDGKLAMGVVAAAEKLDLEAVREAAGGRRIELANEASFAGAFPGCEIGAMPPFGNLYGMPVFVSERLGAGKEIAFNAGSHAELIRMSYRDYERLVAPRVLPIAVR
jgi:Ala-tRNA(Pro) deacylase